jgi:hypothetical protein
VDDRRDVDHAKSDAARFGVLQTARPVREISGERHHLASVIEDWLRYWPEHPAPALRFKKVDSNTALKFGEPLGER